MVDRTSLRTYSRRQVLRLAAVGGASLLVPALWSPRLRAASGHLRTRPIPSTGESLPVVGLGTSGQFNYVSSDQQRKELLRVLEAFYQAGGTLVDTAPLYGRAEEVLGGMLAKLGRVDQTFLATKVRAQSRSEGKQQIERSFRLLKTDTLDLLQVHSLVGWETQLPLIREYRDRDRVRYVGVTHHAGYASDDLADVIERESLDFVQCGYSIAMRDAEQRLLPVARDHNVAVIVNRPFADGDLFRRVKGVGLPAWCREFDCTSWAQFFLKFVLSHPAVTCTIPATSDPKHLMDNMRAGTGALPNADQRERMIQTWEEI